MTKGRMILIVDDEPDLRKLIAESLLMDGFKVAALTILSTGFNLT